MSKFLDIKWKNLQKIAKILKNLGYQDKFWTKIDVQLCESLGYLKVKDILISFCFFFHEKILSGS